MWPLTVVTLRSRRYGPVAPSSSPERQSADTLETQGFESLSSGQLAQARIYFKMAYAAFPTYHNVDEIYHLVLTEGTVDKYPRSSASKKKILRNSIDTILSKYSWGLSDAMRKKLDRNRKRQTARIMRLPISAPQHT